MCYEDDKYKHYRFSLNKWQSGKRVKYVSLGKMLVENYNKNSKKVDSICAMGDTESLLSLEYLIPSEEKSILQEKIADFYQK